MPGPRSKSERIGPNRTLQVALSLNLCHNLSTIQIYASVSPSFMQRGPNPRSKSPNQPHAWTTNRAPECRSPVFSDYSQPQAVQPGDSTLKAPISCHFRLQSSNLPIPLRFFSDISGGNEWAGMAHLYIPPYLVCPRPAFEWFCCNQHSYRALHSDIYVLPAILTVNTDIFGLRV